MSELILYGTKTSPPVRTVLLTLKAIELEFDFKEINISEQEHLSPEFTKKNPQHTVPALDDNGKFIWDSHAIATYLIGKYGSDDTLYPTDLYQRALIDQRLHFDSGILYPRLRAIFEGVMKEGGSPVIPEEKIAALYEAYDFLEKFINGNLYLVGNSLTVADFACVATVSSYQSVAPIDAEKYPKTFGWLERIAELPYYEEANGIGAKMMINFLDKITLKYEEQ